MSAGPSATPNSAAEDPGLAALSRAVLQLHRGSIDWPAGAFNSRACEALASVLFFDACLWGSVPAQASAGAPLGLQGLYAQGLDAQTLAQCLSGAGPTPGVQASHIEPLAGRRVELKLWRFPTSPAAANDFTAAEAQSLQFLLPHLVEAQRENRLGQAYSGDPPARARRSLALCDGQGVLQQIDEQGLALLRVEWPNWRGGSLPAPLQAAIHAAAAARPAPLAGGADPLPAAPTAPPASSSPLPPFYGRGITVLLARSGQGLLLEMRRRAGADRLSTRQRDIAQLYARGHSGPEIAALLGLSASTVNNHLGVVFKKLAVKNKLQLLEAMRLDAE